MATNVQFNIQIWQEGAMFVAYIPQLDLSSCGVSIDEARRNIKEATMAFVEESQQQGALTQILEEAGFTFDKEWKAPEIVIEEKLKLAM